MIWMMWRNIDADTTVPITVPPTPTVRKQLGLEPGGEASLGYYSLQFSTDTIRVDGGARTIKMGYGSGSGITAIQPTGSDLSSWTLWRYTRHEFSHWLLGGMQYHTQIGTWGLLSSWGTPSDVINSFERERLAWINLDSTTITDVSTTRTISSITIPDFVTTGIAYRIQVPGGSPYEFYLLENHQRISAFDIPDANSGTAKGLFVLHQEYNAGDGTSVLSADGRFNWSVPARSPNNWGSGYLPVFRRESSNRVNGYGKRQAIPWYWQGVYQGAAAIHYYINSQGDTIKAPPTIFTGDGKDQFDMSNNTVFSPASNPSSVIYSSNADSIAFEITGISNGVITLNIHVNNPEVASPAKPQDPKVEVYSGYGDWNPRITWTAMSEPDVTTGGNIYVERSRKNTQVYPYNWSSWQTIATLNGTSTEYIDQGITTAGMGNDSVKYRIRARDSQNKYSVYSEEVKMRYDRNLLKRVLVEPKEYLLSQNYPNPFNPSTTIKYEIPADENIIIKVYNLLGSEVATLVNGFKVAGYYEVNFDANLLSSGMYIYRITAGKYSDTRKMTLMK